MTEASDRRIRRKYGLEDLAASHSPAEMSQTPTDLQGISADNREVFGSPEMVEYYRNLTDAQEAEKKILEILRPKLPRVRMLDLGVGGGRTTGTFAPLVAGYVGVDVADAMVQACKDRFGTSNPGWTFRVADARALDDFENESFGFVLFSFNGLDCMSHEDRLRSFCEIQRVLEPEGAFAFSTHNLNSPFQSRFSVRKARGVASGVRLLVQGIKFRLLNPRLREVRRGDYALIRDGTGSFRGVNYYVTPRAQRAQLEERGFQGIRVFDHSGGRELMGEEEEGARDPWLYYLCYTPHSDAETPS